MKESRFIFITGGARSGKSAFAEQFAMTLAKKAEKSLCYVATAKRSDNEMVDRIQRHQADRNASPMSWETAECPTISVVNTQEFAPDQVVLFDCLTILLSNELFKRGLFEENLDRKTIQTDAIKAIMEGMTFLSRRVHTLIVVSNEVSYDTVIRDTTAVEIYRETLGLLHQSIVEQSVEAYAVETGIPIQMKGG